MQQVFKKRKLSQSGIKKFFPLCTYQITSNKSHVRSSLPSWELLMPKYLFFLLLTLSSAYQVFKVAKSFLCNWTKANHVFVLVGGTVLTRDISWKIPEKLLRSIMSCLSRERIDMALWKWKTESYQWAFEDRIILKMDFLFILLRPTTARVMNGNCLLMNESVPWRTFGFQLPWNF